MDNQNVLYLNNVGLFGPYICDQAYVTACTQTHTRTHMNRHTGRETCMLSSVQRTPSILNPRHRPPSLYLHANGRQQSASPKPGLNSTPAGRQAGRLGGLMGPDDCSQMEWPGAVKMGPKRRASQVSEASRDSRGSPMLCCTRYTIRGELVREKGDDSAGP